MTFQVVVDFTEREEGGVFSMKLDPRPFKLCPLLEHRLVRCRALSKCRRGFSRTCEHSTAKLLRQLCKIRCVVDLNCSATLVRSQTTPRASSPHLLNLRLNRDSHRRRNVRPSSRRTTTQRLPITDGLCRIALLNRELIPPVAGVLLDTNPRHSLQFFLIRVIPEYTHQKLPVVPPNHTPRQNLTTSLHYKSIYTI